VFTSRGDGSTPPAPRMSAKKAPATSIVSPVTRLMCAWLIGSIHSPAWPALKSQSAFFGCTWITPWTVPTVSAAAPVAKNFQRCHCGLGTRTRRDWKMVTQTFVAKHQ